MPRFVKQCQGVAETLALGRALGGALGAVLESGQDQAGPVICLQGAMGAGKTHFVKGLAEGLGVAQQDHVISPTYDLVHEHGDPCRLVHIDLYRIAVPGAEDVEWLLGYLNEAGTVKAIEWPERISDVMPDDALTVDIDFGAGEDDRVITFSAANSLPFDFSAF
jgi:tRNA threonylcarbamoyladenosine biosynthesis protein TsaE